MKLSLPDEKLGAAEEAALAPVAAGRLVGMTEWLMIFRTAGEKGIVVCAVGRTLAVQRLALVFLRHTTLRFNGLGHPTNTLRCL